ncbi:merR regulatory family protein [Clostridium argentinense CDC 2741]|uniref:MerR regulatory family protein n=1 Tax=Clostridium argentinense CDC 2741 TaxID=1418104 RepID=A0A0C1QVL3_9CLOT|nr:MerR family transcriptional regulator [Clostridium argentinense]KIE45007.1 merR regulatory family protein [Clostridium argentinense CDC 2741]
MYTIGQVARFLGVSRDTLKFYEEKGLVKPVQDKENGYRRYSLFDIDDVLTVNFYREIDVEIKQIQKLKNHGNLEEIESLLDKQEKK